MDPNEEKRLAEQALQDQANAATEAARRDRDARLEKFKQWADTVAFQCGYYYKALVETNKVPTSQAEWMMRDYHTKLMQYTKWTEDGR